MSKHTPGPLEVEIDQETLFEHHVWTQGGRKSGRLVAVVREEADARLFAVAAEMRELVFELATYCADNDDRHACELVRVARGLVDRIDGIAEFIS